MAEILSYMDLIKEIMEEKNISSDDDILFRRVELSDMTDNELEGGLFETPLFEKPDVTPVFRKIDLNEAHPDVMEREWYKDNELKPKDAWLIGLNVEF